MEVAPERFELKPVSEMGRMPPDSPVKSYSSQGAAEDPEVAELSAAVDEDHQSQVTAPASSTSSLPIFPIGIGLLAAMGAVVYFIVSLHGPSPGTRDASRDQPAVITPTLGSEPIKQSSAATTHEKPILKQEASAVRTVATQPKLRSSPAKTITRKDGAPMVLIPAGEFWMGSPDSVPEDDEHPVHRVILDEFYMDKFEVTNRSFNKFVLERNYRTTADRKGKTWAYINGRWSQTTGANWKTPEAGSSVFDSNRADHPVVSVSWEDADAYCRWLGKQLPTEAQWEYAARGGTETEYWWGNMLPPRRKVENFADESLKSQYPNRRDPIVIGYDDGYARTAPAGSFDSNPWGLHDVLGNVREWTADWYDEAHYKTGVTGVLRNPSGPSHGNYRVWRGGSWNDPSESMKAIRVAKREHRGASTSGPDVGFRCVSDAS